MRAHVGYTSPVPDLGCHSTKRCTAILISGILFFVCVKLVWSADLVKGDKERGRRLFESKGCIECHVPPGREKEVGPPLAALQKRQGLYQLAGRWWNHVPAMQKEFLQRGKPWPTLGAQEVADLAEWLMARQNADPRGNEAKGRLLILKKGCLKCHALFGEGSRIGPDLSSYPHYNSPVEWAASVWNHSPKMRAKAEELRIDFPRFEANEMVDLVEFLKISQ